MVWIVEWQQPEVSDFKVTVFARESDAFMQVAHDIMEQVMDWDLSDSDIEAIARSINDYVSVGDYKNALSKFNDDQATLDTDQEQFFFVYERKENIGAQAPNLIIFSDVDEDEEDEEEDEDETIPPTARSGDFKTSVPGATCRGPCGNYNPDAYADMSDGTYCCYQCKLMSQVFGGKVP